MKGRDILEKWTEYQWSVVHHQGAYMHLIVIFKTEETEKREGL